MFIICENFDVYCARESVRTLDLREYDAFHWPTMTRETQSFRMVEVADGITNRWFHLLDPHNSVYVPDQQNIRFSRPLPQWCDEGTGDVRLPDVIHGHDGVGLVIGGMKNHWHFLINFLPRLVAAKEMLSDAFDSVDYIVLHEMSDVQKLLVERMLPGKKLVTISNATADAYQFEKLIYLSFPQNLFFSEALLGATRRQVLGLGEAQGPAFERIFVDRNPKIPRRRLAGRKQNIDVLTRHGVPAVYCEDYDFFGQASLFSSADFVVGLHGAGMANMLFCKLNIPVLIIDYKWPSEMFGLARVMGLRAMPLIARQVPTEGVTDGRLRDLHVAPKQLDAAVSALLSW